MPNTLNSHMITGQVSMPVERNETLLCAVCREPVLEVYDSGGTTIGFVCSKCQLKFLARDANGLLVLA